MPPAVPRSIAHGCGTRRQPEKFGPEHKESATRRRPPARRRSSNTAPWKVQASDSRFATDRRGPALPDKAADRGHGPHMMLQREALEHGHVRRLESDLVGMD